MKSDIEIARSIELKKIKQVAEGVGIPREEVENYGRYIAKIPEQLIDEEKVKKSADISNHGLSISSRHLPFHRGNYDRHYGRHNKGNALRVNKRDASEKLLGRHPFS